MNCKNCQQELEPGVQVCPNCGADNTEPADEKVIREEELQVPAAEEQEAAAEVQEDTAEVQEDTAEVQEDTAEVQEDTAEPAAEEKKPSAGRLTLVVAACVVLIAVLAALILNGMGLLNREKEPTVPTESHPADTNLNDETCKGTYTGTDEEVVAAGETVIARAGDLVMTNNDLQVYYWMMIGEFVSTYKYESLDLTKPLDTQMCELSEGRTWQQYFLAAALNNWQSYASLAQAGEAIGVKLPQEDLDALAAMESELDAQAGMYGFENGAELLKGSVGAGGVMANYIAYNELNWKGYAYYQHAHAAMEASEAEIEKYFDEHVKDYAKEDVTKESKRVDVRHLLIFPEGATYETVFSQTYPEEAWAASRTRAEELLQQWHDGDATEASFEELVKEYTEDPTSKEKGGLITGIMKGQMVENFENWCFDSARKIGDIGIAETEYGYHIIYYVGEDFIWDDYAKADVLTEKLANHIQETMDAYPMEVDYKSILLGHVSLA